MSALALHQQAPMPKIKTTKTSKRLVHRGEAGLSVYCLESEADPQFVVVDQLGRVLERARSELIAIAKMQALLLQRLQERS